MSKQRLELDWIGKDDEHVLEPRILLPDEQNSYGDKASQNMLVHGDNLLALKALESDFANKIKCVFIDPPYNTGSAFEHYDDGLEHSVWLSLMRDRLKVLAKLLREDGSIWITIDDNEAHYLKVLCDEIFGRKNFVTSIAWEKDEARHNDAVISSSHDHILVFAKNLALFRKTRNLLPRNIEGNKRYKNPDNDPRGPWLQGACSTAKSGSEKSRFPVTLPSGRKIVPPPGNYWRFSEATLQQAISDKRVYYGKNGDRLPIIKSYLSEVQDGFVPKTWWPASEVGSNQSAKRDHLRKLLAGIEPFSTPKPEGLLHRILTIATNEGDWVLDSFAGSGTTGAVAQKMGRRWVMVELGQHCMTHIIPRLRKVTDGKDPGGVTDLVRWEGGAGFKFKTLAPSLLEKDDRGQWIISKKYNATMLAAAVCKHEGFKFHPDQKVYWKQGYSTKKDFIFVTTQFLTAEQLQRIHDHLKPDETLLICAKAFKVPANKFDQITLKKIPQSLLTRGIEFGRDDYSLNVKEPVQEEMELDAET